MVKTEKVLEMQRWYDGKETVHYLSVYILPPSQR